MMTPLTDSTKQELLNMMRRFKSEKFHPITRFDGVTTTEANVIFSIYMAKIHGMDPVQPRMIALRLKQTPSALSQTLKAVEEKGYICRHRTSKDSRVVSLVLTEKGKKLADDFEKAQDDFFEELVDCLGEDDIEHLLATFTKVYDFLSQKADAGTIQRGFGGACMHAPFPPSFENEMQPSDSNVCKDRETDDDKDNE